MMQSNLAFEKLAQTSQTNFSQVSTPNRYFFVQTLNEMIQILFFDLLDDINMIVESIIHFVTFLCQQCYMFIFLGLVWLHWYPLPSISIQVD